jgi:hypothetical protein
VAAPLVLEHFDVIEYCHLGLAEAIEAIGQPLFTVEKKVSITAVS